MIGEWTLSSGNVSDRQVFLEILVGLDIPASLFDAHFDLQLAAFADGGDVHVRIEDLDIRIRGDVAGRQLSGLVRFEIDRFRVIHVELERNLLQVHDDVGGIFRHVGDRRELVKNAFDLDGRDRRPLDGGQQDPAQRISDGRAETSFEGLGIKVAVGRTQGLEIADQSFWLLKSFSHNFPLTSSLPYFE